MLLNLNFANNTIFSCFFFFFFFIELSFLIPAVIEQIFNPTAELVIPIGTQNKEAKAQFEARPVIAGAKIRNLQYKLKL